MAQLRLAGQQLSEQMQFYPFAGYLWELAVLYKRYVLLASPQTDNLSAVRSYYLSSRFYNPTSGGNITDIPPVQILNLRTGSYELLIQSLTLIGGAVVALKAMAEILQIIRDWDLDRDKKRLVNRKLRNEIRTQNLDFIERVPETVKMLSEGDGLGFSLIPLPSDTNSVRRRGRSTRDKILDRIQRDSIAVAIAPFTLLQVEFIPDISVFMIYSSRDENTVSRLQRALSANGIEVYHPRANLRIESIFTSQIADAIQNSTYVLVVLSANSLGSQWVEQEIALALEKEYREKRRILIPVLIDDAARRSEVFWVQNILRERQFIDFRDTESEVNYADAFANLMHRITASGNPQL